MQTKRWAKLMNQMIGRWEENELISAFQADLLRQDFSGYIRDKRRRFRKLLYITMACFFCLIALLAYTIY